MNFEQILQMAVIFIYSISTFTIFVGTLSMQRKIKIWANWGTLLGFFVHTLAILFLFISEPFSSFTSVVLMQFFSWLIVLLYLLAWKFLRLPFLALTAAPLALLVYILSLRTGTQAIMPDTLSALFFGLHICALFTSLGLLAMAFGAGIFFIYLENKIKLKAPLKQFAKGLPALGLFDKVNKIAVMFGFPLYTLGIMSSFIWLPLSQYQLKNPKILLSLIIWFLFALLFYQRMALGFQGRKTALMAILIFLVSVFSLALDFFVVSHHSNLFLQ